MLSFNTVEADCPHCALSKLRMSGKPGDYLQCGSLPHLGAQTRAEIQGGRDKQMPAGQQTAQQAAQNCQDILCQGSEAILRWQSVSNFISSAVYRRYECLLLSVLFLSFSSKLQRQLYPCRSLCILCAAIVELWTPRSELKPPSSITDSIKKIPLAVVLHPQTGRQAQTGSLLAYTKAQRTASVNRDSMSIFPKY